MTLRLSRYSLANRRALYCFEPHRDSFDWTRRAQGCKMLSSDINATGYFDWHDSSQLMICTSIALPLDKISWSSTWDEILTPDHSRLRSTKHIINGFSLPSLIGTSSTFDPCNHDTQDGLPLESLYYGHPPKFSVCEVFLSHYHLQSCRRSSFTMSDTVSTVLPQAVGYGVVVGIGFFFTFVMIGISMLQVCVIGHWWCCVLISSQNKYTNFSTKTSEEFNTASRSVKPGLIAAGIGMHAPSWLNPATVKLMAQAFRLSNWMLTVLSVSAWTWAATLLQSSTVAYTYGVAGPFWVWSIRDILDQS